MGGGGVVGREESEVLQKKLFSTRQKLNCQLSVPEGTEITQWILDKCWMQYFTGVRLQEVIRGHFQIQNYPPAFMAAGKRVLLSIKSIHGLQGTLLSPPSLTQSRRIQAYRTPVQTGWIPPLESGPVAFEFTYLETE